MKMWQDKRSNEQEILDLGSAHYSAEEYNNCLKLLERINFFLGGFRASWKALKALNKSPASILEVGCGGGYLCQHLHRWFPYATVQGIDISSEAIDHAQKHLPVDFKKNVFFRIQDDKTIEYPDNSFDVVTTMLVCHHMTDDELVTFLQQSYRVCSQAVVINDLHRHILAYISFSLVAPFAFPNRLIWHDGRLSVRRSFHKRDWLSLLEKAGFQKHQYTLKWNPAFRWTLTIKKT
ncbi:MAG: methyltransferase domain-containing protein [Chlamydiia bacterium]|nr:methyltransferase domain-containing protein [Chlamydiia bacterium]